MAKSVASQGFRDFQASDVVDENFDTTKAVSRALRIFLISFTEYQQICPQIYEQMFGQYLNEIQTLYGEEIDGNIIEEIRNSLNSIDIEIIIGIKMITGRHLVTNPRIIISNVSNASQWIQLNPDEDIQRNVLYSENMSFSEFSNNRRNKSEIIISMDGDYFSMDWSDIHQFIIKYNEIPAEGYEDWFYFGGGVHLLIKIEFKVHEKSKRREKRFDSNFHLHSIIYMIRERLKIYRKQSIVGPIHRRFARRLDVSHYRKRLETITEQAFWSQTITRNDIRQSIQTIADTEGNYANLRSALRINVKFCDLQIGYHFADSIYERVCVCSEWCNWSAFFYYNPIYRFLMVQNNQLFLKSRSNVGDMYLFGTAFCTFEAGFDSSPNGDFESTPLLRLMNCANDYRNLNYQRYYLTNQVFKDEYDNSFPEIELLNGVTYNLIRREIPLPKFWIQSDVNPFSEVCIENICNFYRLYSELHVWCSTRRTLIYGQDIRLWFKELDQTSRSKYRAYIKLGYDILMRRETPTYDYLFTEDYDYLKQICDPTIKAIRDNIYKIGINDNPFNTRIICNPFLSALNSVHKFVRKVEPFLPLPKKFQSLNDIYETFKTLDRDFTAFANESQLEFKLDEEFIREKHLNEFRVDLTVFFTLKVYSVSFGIQSNCINSLVKMKSKSKYKPDQFSLEFNFIWNSPLIERTFRDHFLNVTLFDIQQNIENIEHSFDGFYERYWGRADHEVNQTSQFAANIASAYYQYQRLYFWWKNDGNNKFKFTSFLNSLNPGFHRISEESEIIYQNYILKSIKQISETYDNHIEVLDVLVLYLVKAICYMNLSLLSKFMKKVHSLQNGALVRKKICYSMYKPGWVQIFRTIRDCFQSIDNIQNHFIVFDDEFNKISKTIDETKQMIHEIYREFYRKVSHDFSQEINKMGELKNLYPNSDEFVSLHLAVGLSFIVYFVDYFRKVSRFYRKFLIEVLEYVSDTPAPHQDILNNYLNVFQDYMSNRQEIERAMPLLWEEWQQHISFVDWNQFNELTEQDVQLDLVYANNN